MENRLDPTPHLERFESYEQACREFRWRIPHRLNVASAICRRHADAVTRIALSEVMEAGINTYTLGGLDFLSDKFATALFDSGIRQGDSVAVLLPPSAALAIAHLAALKAGAVVVPLSMAPDGAPIEYAIADSRARTLVVVESKSAVVGALAQKASYLKSRFVVRDFRPPTTSTEVKDFWSEVDRSSADFDAVETDANSAAFIFYVESHGQINGLVHSHRSVIGQLTAFEMFYDVKAETDAVLWTPGDWSSPGEVLGVLYPAWWYGCSVVAGASAGAAGALRLMERCEVTHAFISSEQLEALASTEPQASEGLELKVRTVVTETPLWPEYLVNSNHRMTLNEVCGRPETGWIFGKCERLFATATGSIGRPVPGRLVAIIDENGNPLPPGHVGHIAISISDPGLFTEYRGAARAAASFIGEWFLSGAVGYKNEDGDLYLSPSSRVVGAD